MKTIKNNRGLTLVELLASVVLLSIILVFVFSLLSNSTKNYSKQSYENKNLYDSTYMLKIITKDIRKSSSYDETNMQFLNPQGSIVATYKWENNSLMRNGELISDNLSYFSITPTIDNQGVSLSITTSDGNTSVTELYFRRDN